MIHITGLDISQQELEKEFGKKVVEILQGFSRITEINSMQSSYQAENFQKAAAQSC